jgi:predicted SprT family Zn-dependent metalloprotease
MRLNGEIMSKNQEATIKISSHTLTDLRIMKAEGGFKSYDALLKILISTVEGKNEN